MQTLRHYWYVFALVFSLVFVLVSLLPGGRIEGQSLRTSRSARSLASLTGGTPSQTAGTRGSAGGTPSQTPGTRGSVASPTTSQTAGTSGSVGSSTTYRPGGHLIIPIIGVNAPIEPVGVSSNGDLAVPTQQPWDGVGWYQSGPYPGAQGSAVIDGHLDRPGGSPAVFWNLQYLHIGDSVMVVNPGEKPLHFRVMNMQYYAPNTAPLQKIFRNKTGIFLNLITCAGLWIPSQHQTTLRLVIYTALEA